MKIQSRILMLLGGVFIASMAIIGAVLFAVILPAFEHLDEELAAKNVNRVRQAIAGELTGLNQKAIDWAHWTDTYEFVANRNADFIEANLQPDSLINLGVDFMAFYDAAGEPVWVGGFDAETQAPLPLGGLADRRQMAELLARAVAEAVEGLISVDGKFFLVATRDILDSDGNGPSHGTLVVGRAFDEAFRRQLTDRTEVNFRFVPHVVSSSSDPPLDVSVATRLVKSGELLVDRISLFDAAGAPAIDLDIETPRDAGNLGHSSIFVAATLLIATAFAVMIILAFAINWLVVLPIRRMHRAMELVAASTSLDQRLAWSRNDEFGLLAAQFDKMLERIAQTRRDLLEMTFKVGRSDLAMGMFHNIRNAMSPLANQLHRAGASLHASGDSNVERALSEIEASNLDPSRRAKLAEFLRVAWSQQVGRAQVAKSEIEAANGQLSAVEQILNQQHEEGLEVATETLPLAFLIKESLNFFSDGQLASADVKVDPGIVTMPDVSVQRLPIIHVIYNVVANAIAAIEALGRGRGQVLIRAAENPDGKSLRLEIVDDGIGVDPKLLTEIFRAGYTTKVDKKGGEGLHWCANTLSANGGRVWAESAGPGLGLTICIDIPRATPRIDQGGQVVHVA